MAKSKNQKTFDKALGSMLDTGPVTLKQIRAENKAKREAKTKK